MRAQRQQVFRTSATSRLDAIELTAALLVRQAINNRAVIVERSAPVLSAPGHRRRRFVRCRNIARRGGALSRRCAAAIVGLALHPRLHAAARETWAFGADTVVVLSTALVAVAVLAAAILIGAPPV